MNKKKTNDEFLKELEEKGRFDIQPLEEYKGAKEKILCKCLQNEDHDDFYITPTHLLSGEGCPKCGWEKLSKIYVTPIEIYEQRLQEKGVPMKVVGEYNRLHKPVTLKCPEGHLWYVEQARQTYAKYNREGCPICNKLKNSIANRYPECVAFLKNKELAKVITIGAKEKVECICPDCGEEFELTVSQLINNKNKCPFCAVDTLSRPNRLLYEFLIENKENCQEIKTEKTFKWSKKYKFDGYFKKDGVEYLIEMHGKQHYEQMFNNDFELQKKRDKEKIELAEKNRFSLIIIECKVTEFDYIINNIKKSKLKDIFDLDNINWENLKIKCMTKISKQILDYYNQNKTISEISDIMDLRKGFVEKFLYKKAQSGEIVYNRILFEKIIHKKVKITKISTGEERLYNFLTEVKEDGEFIDTHLELGTMYKHLKGGYKNYKTKKYTELPNIYKGFKIEYSDILVKENNVM